MSADEQDTRAQDTREFYSVPGVMTSPGRHACLLAGLPDEPAAIAAVLHGLVIHEHMAGGYGVTLSEADRGTVHVRRAGDLLAEIAARDQRPLDVARSPAGRMPGNCRHFTVMAAALLRAHGIPARARCGFGGYFGTGWFEDHWVCEYWHVGHQRWQLLDAQIDSVQRGWFPIDFALAALFDRLAELTLAPDDNFVALRRLYADDERLRVPATVRNAVRGDWEPLWPADSEASAE